MPSRFTLINQKLHGLAVLGQLLVRKINHTTPCNLITLTSEPCSSNPIMKSTAGNPVSINGIGALHLHPQNLLPYEPFQTNLL